MNNLQNAWLIRPHQCGENKIQEFRDNNIVAIGWPGTGNLQGKSRENLKQLFSGSPYNYEGKQLGDTYATVDIFVNQIKPGSLAVLPDNDDIYFVEITSGYSYNQEPGSNNKYPHQRTVKWLGNTLRKNLSDGLRNSLKAGRITADLSKHFDEINALAHGKTYTPVPGLSGTINVSYPLRPGCMVSFTIPDDITKDEARRLSSYLASLYFAQ